MESVASERKARSRWMRNIWLFLGAWLLLSITLIAVFIMQKNIMATVLTSVLCFVNVQLVYWYYRVKVLQSYRRQVRNAIALAAAESGNSHYNPAEDKPPSYEEIMKADPPPPSYYEIAKEYFKNFNQSSSVPTSPAPSIKSNRTETTPRSSNHNNRVLEPIHRPTNQQDERSGLRRENANGLSSYDNSGYLEDRLQSRDHNFQGQSTSKKQDTIETVINVEIHNKDTNTAEMSHAGTLTSSISSTTRHPEIVDPLSTIRQPITRSMNSSQYSSNVTLTIC